VNIPDDVRWLLLIHQIPPTPNYFRVKIWRRLQRLGAVAIKNSVYVLPRNDQAQEDLQWIAREVVEGGGEASICEARFVEGLTDGQVEALFQVARDADYAQIAEEVRTSTGTMDQRGSIDESLRSQIESELVRFRRRVADVAAIDFFGAPGRQAAEVLLEDLKSRLRRDREAPPKARRSAPRIGEYRGRTWVTRKGVHVDRIACAWLIRKFIDEKARFKFVPGKNYTPRPGEIRFDMFEAEFTHLGDACTFEVLLSRFRISDRALAAIAQIVHEIDLKDSKFGRQDALSLNRLIAGIAMGHNDDDARLARGAAVFEDLYEYFRRRPS